MTAPKSKAREERAREILRAPFGATKCPKCGAESRPYDWNEVDIGIGVQTYEHEWECPEHGCFSYVFDQAANRSAPLFRDDCEQEQTDG
jgi:predicted nucleic-acid-binding Zn-ribbon protein